jgi:hypothetical protein
MSTYSRPFDDRRRTLPAVLAILLVGGALTAGLVTACLGPGLGDNPPSAGGGGSAVASGELPPQLFQGWPGNGAKKPDVALILSGQQHSFLKFCGCTSPQLGGFERRYNFMAMLKAKGWPLVAADLGDVVKYDGGIHDQSLLKYEVAMKALNILGYSAIGLGADDVSLPLIDGMALFGLQQGNTSPRILAANLDPKYRADNFPDPVKPNESMIGDWLPVTLKGAPKVGIAALIGKSTMKEIKAADPKVQFAANNGAVVAAIEKEMKAANVELRVLLFQGAAVDAPTIAQTYPSAFDVILTLSDEDTPPGQANVVGNTTIVRVGHRGKWVGVVGAYRTGNPQRPFDLFWQTVSLGPEFETPKDKEKDHPVLKLLDYYAAKVKSEDFVKRTPVRQLPGGLKYIGSQACANCHAADVQLWKNTKHEHAFDALVSVANKPALRQYDPECISCHVTGFDAKNGRTAFDGTIAARQFRNVNCENCHGPGSAHAAAPQNPQLRMAMSPWKANPGDLLPTPAKMAAGIGAMSAQEKAVYLRVNDMCQKCHDIDNDPHFKLDTFWPKIIHGKNAKAPIPPPAAAAKNGK